MFFSGRCCTGLVLQPQVQVPAHSLIAFCAPRPHPMPSHSFFTFLPHLHPHLPRLLLQLRVGDSIHTHNKLTKCFLRARFIYKCVPISLNCSQFSLSRHMELIVGERAWENKVINLFFLATGEKTLHFRTDRMTGRKM